MRFESKMLNSTVKITNGAQSPGLEKQVTFALASALTLVAKEAQTQVIKTIESTFTVRNTWDQPSNAMGIKVLPATKNDLSSAVVTRADWLNPHEDGEDKTPTAGGSNIAIPTAEVRRTKRDIIRRDQRPRGLMGKRDVVIKTSKGPALFQRKGRGATSRLVLLYFLKPRTHIKKQSTMLEPTRAVVDKRFGQIFFEQLRKAFSTAK